jgi:hypothetical protein
VVVTMLGEVPVNEHGEQPVCGRPSDAEFIGGLTYSQFALIS